MKVFVIGGTGAIGTRAVQALVRSHTITALARTPEKAEQLRKRGASPVKVSLYDEPGLTDAFRGHDAVVNLASSIPAGAKFMDSSASAECDRVREEGSTTVVNAALAARVGRLVQESVCMLYPDSGDAWIDESTPADRFPMAEGNLATEANAQRFTDGGGIGVVLRQGWFYGHGAKHSEEFFHAARNYHTAVMMGAPGGYVSSIHVADGGEAVAAALGVPAGTYNVVDDEPLTKAEYADALSAASGTSQWLRFPGRAALLLGNRTTSLTRSLRVSNARFKQASGWEPEYRSAREGWVATAAVLLGENAA